MKIAYENYDLLIDQEDFIKYVFYGIGIKSDGKGYNYPILYKAPYRGMQLSRIILNATSTEIVDHKDRNPLNNQRNNLRLVTASQSMMNRGNWNSFGIKGISKNKSGWAASIMVDRKKIYLGTFSTPIAAGNAYATATIKYFKEYSSTVSEPKL